jgi:hypothetical protein
MASKKQGASGVRREAHAAVKRGDTRRRVRELTVRALRERDLEPGDISDLVQDVLQGAADAVDRSIPSSRENVLRQVFDGLDDAVSSVARAGSKAVQGVRERGRAIADGAVPTAAKRVRAANDEFIRAVRLFAKRTSTEIGEELESLSDRARRTGSTVSRAAANAAGAADGRVLELTGEAARAGLSAARRAAGGIAMAASGLLEGLGEVMLPSKGAAQASKTRAKGKPAGKKASTRKKTSKKASKKKTAKKSRG